jgi:hypothetical protein
LTILPISYWSSIDRLKAGQEPAQRGSKEPGCQLFLERGERPRRNEKPEDEMFRIATATTAPQQLSGRENEWFSRPENEWFARENEWFTQPENEW